MIIENSVESVKEAKQLLGLPAEASVGFVRREWHGKLEYQPVIEAKGRTWYVGDEVLPE